MGSRFAEATVVNPKKWRVFLWGVKTFSDIQLWNESVKASNYYVTKKKYTRIASAELALIRATLSHGFRAGYRWRENLG